jgi:hypothetical protein
LFSALFFANAQNDTLLYNGFDKMIYSVGQTDTVLNYKAINDSNTIGSSWFTYADNPARISSNLTTGEESNPYFDAELWRSWHISPYTVLSDTIKIEKDSSIVLEIKNNGIRSFSWISPKDKIFNVLLSPNVWIGGDSSLLRWKSMPLQGPRHQDGYQVFIIRHGGKDPLTIDFNSIAPSFEMKRMDVSNGSPDTNIKSLAYLENNFGFYPQNGVMHTNYKLYGPDTTGFVDSTIQIVSMQEFELNLSHIKDEFIQVAFVHNSYDNVGIVLDDILILGSGTVGTMEIQKKSMHLFPNPSTKFVRVVLGNDIPLVANVFTSNGQVLKTINLKGSCEINVSEYKKGYYIIEIIGEKGRYSARFMKKN